jgi:hypothetical protein
MAVMIDDDIFIDMCWERVDQFCPDSFSKEFWDAAFEYFKEIGWLSNPTHNRPSIIVDNIYVNGEIHTLEEIRSSYSYPNMDKMSDEELRDYIIDEQNWMEIGDRFVKRWGV